MGAEPFEHLVEFQPDAQSALDALRDELAPGESEPSSEMSFGMDRPAILFISAVSSRRQPGCATPLTPEEVLHHFGTQRPTRSHTARADSLWDELDRGSAVFTTLYVGERPRWIWFAGYSFD